MRRRLVRAAEIVAPRLLFHYRVSKYSSYEPEQRLIPHLCDKQHIAIDVGANIGIYAGLMVRHAKVCRAFEANPRLAHLLDRTAIPGLTVTHAALSDRTGQVCLHVPRHVHGLATLEAGNIELQRRDVGPVDTFRVPAIRLDDIPFDPVSLIKIDVEGHEEAVLRGAVETIGTHRPSLIVESDNRHNPGVVQRIFVLFASLGYEGFFLRDGALRPLCEFDAKRHQDPAVLERVGFSAYTYNFIFVPPERAAILVGRFAASARPDRRATSTTAGRDREK